MLNGSNRRYLRSLAHHLKPVVHVGKGGVERGLLETVGLALEAHELIKIKFVDSKERKRELSREIAGSSKSELVGLIGNMAILFRENPDEKKRKIRIP